jgi:hypothetical protein
MPIYGISSLNSVTSIDICAKEVSKAMIEKLEKEISLFVCKMEKVFAPGWFNVMQHLLVHLHWEARVGGPVQFM